MVHQVNDLQSGARCCNLKCIKHHKQVKVIKFVGNNIITEIREAPLLRSNPWRVNEVKCPNLIADKLSLSDITVSFLRKATIVVLSRKRSSMFG